jgi:DNA processing protein
MNAGAAGPPLPTAAWTAALSGLAGMGPRRLRAVLERWSAQEAWEAIGADAGAVRAVLAEIDPTTASTQADEWQRRSAEISVASVWSAATEGGGAVALPGGPGFPGGLADDVEPPAILFTRGSASVLPGPTVAIVGTRRCTTYGSTTAWELARGLAEHGVRVVSGLALGIDAAAHAGALAADEAPPIGVVATGLDVVYPRQNRALWGQVAQRGLLLTEAAPGTRPERWRFPSRNRIIAALAQVVVVVESPERGGSMYTVTEALRRDRAVMAVPGPITAPSSSGTNKLLAEGAPPVLGVDDVLVALGLEAQRPADTADRRPSPSAHDQRVLDACGWEPATVDQLAIRTGLGLGELLRSVQALVATGWIADDNSGWLRRLVRPAPGS